MKKVEDWEISSNYAPKLIWAAASAILRSMPIIVCAALTGFLYFPLYAAFRMAYLDWVTPTITVVLMAAFFAVGDIIGEIIVYRMNYKKNNKGNK